jgi:hypothetical protein
MLMLRKSCLAAVVATPIVFFGPSLAAAGTISPTLAKSLVFTPGSGFSIEEGEVIAAYPSFPVTGPEWRGIMEFDLSTLTPTPNANVTLYLRDTGGLTCCDSTTNVYYYVGDGVGTSADYTRLDNFLMQITRPWKGVPSTTLHDVTAAVNAIALAGHQYIGFLFVEASNLGKQEDAFGTMGAFTPSLDEPPTNRTSGLVFSDAALPSAVPLPGALPLFAGGLAALGLLGWRRRKQQVS